jgi:GNAT superfamily N-acetyltransferase
VADNIVLSAATAGDKGTLSDLRAEWAAEDGRTLDNRFSADFSDWFDAEATRRVFWLARHRQTPVGMVNLILFDRMPSPGRSPRAWGYLGNMYVRASERDRGIGNLLIQSLLQHADTLQLVRVLLNPSERARPLYQRAGFTPVDDELLVRHLPNPTMRQPSDQN